MTGGAGSPTDVIAALYAARTSIKQQKELADVVVRDASLARAELRGALSGVASPLVDRALGNYAQAVVRLRNGAWLLADAAALLAEYAEAAAPESAEGVEGCPLPSRIMNPDPDAV